MLPRLSSLLYGICLYLSSATSGISAQQIYAIDGSQPAFEFHGIGGLSAGASSRLLFDYPAEQQSDILDFLYKPNHGAGLQICKVEIGGDCQSTDGTEPSHMHYADDLSCERGYEFQLIIEAKKRNPAVLTYGLSWGVPHWIGNGSYFSSDNWAYQTAFATCVVERTGYALDYIGIWNERSWGTPDYIIGLRAALDAAGHTSTKIILPDDDVAVAPIIALATANATFNASFYGIGMHYEHNLPNPEVHGAGKIYMNSEDFSSNSYSWGASQAWMTDLVRNYVNNNMTGTIAWSTIWSVLPSLPYTGCGLMLAQEPWSGHYNVTGAIWVSAHYGQFSAPGWRHLAVGAGAGLLGSTASDTGAYVTLVPPSDLSDFSLIIETMGKGAQNATFQLSGGLPGAGTSLSVWSTTESAYFLQQASITVASDGSFTVPLPADGIVTVSTLQTAVHGVPSNPIPSPSPFPIPYTDTFDGSFDSLPKFLSDQGGSFAVRNGTLVQVVTTRPGPNAWVNDPDPITYVGDFTPWTDIQVAVSVSLPSPSSSLRSSDDSPPALVLPCAEMGPTASAQQWTFNNPASSYLSNTVAGAQICLNTDGCPGEGSNLIYYECVVDGGTCCGPSCYDGLKFALSAEGLLTTPLASLAGLCATVNVTAGGVIFMLPCSASNPPPLNQTWSYNSTSLQLQSGAGDAATPSCLTSNLIPVPPYAQVCARVTDYSGFAGPVPVPGYCLHLEGDGTWRVLARGTTLGNGTLDSTFNPTAFNALSLSVKGTTISASVAGASLGTFTDSNNTFTAGGIAFGSGYHFAYFDDFSLANA